MLFSNVIRSRTSDAALVYFTSCCAIRNPASDLPHSRHDDFDRDVINPQNGHILCVRTSPVLGVIVTSSFPKKLAMEVNHL